MLACARIKDKEVSFMIYRHVFINISIHVIENGSSLNILINENLHLNSLAVLSFKECYGND